MNLTGYGSAGPGGPPQPAAEAAAPSSAAAAASQQLHERPKYVFGQSVEPEQQGGVYVESSQVQNGYDANAYTAQQASASGYQDAQREYQGGGAYAFGGYYGAEQTQADAGGYYAPGAGQYYDYPQPQGAYDHHGQYQAQSQHQPQPSQEAYGGM